MCLTWLVFKLTAAESIHFTVIHVIPRGASEDYTRFNPLNHVKEIAATMWEGESAPREFHFLSNSLIYMFFSGSSPILCLAQPDDRTSCFEASSEQHILNRPAHVRGYTTHSRADKAVKHDMFKTSTDVLNISCFLF